MWNSVPPSGIKLGPLSVFLRELVQQTERKFNKWQNNIKLFRILIGPLLAHTVIADMALHGIACGLVNQNGK